MDDILKSIKIDNAEYYNKTVIYLYILKYDFVDAIKIQATNTWKVINIKCSLYSYLIYF